MGCTPALASGPGVDLPQEIPAHEDLLALHLEKPAAGEVIQGTRDGLARSPDEAGDLLLRRSFADEQAPVRRLALLLRQLADGARHARVDVEQREVSDHLVGVA